jgi:hypothetical protein
MLHRLVLATILLLAVATTAAAATSPGDTYQAAIVALGTQHTVHYVSTSNLGGDAETMVGDAARDRGIQRITYSHAGTTGHVTVLVVKTTAYVHGDAFALTSYLGLTSAQAARYSGRWFYLRPPGNAYATVAEAVRMGSFVDELLMPGPYTVAPVKSFAGKRYTGVRTKLTRSGQTAVVSLYIAAGTHLPVAQVIEGSTGKITTTLGKWNERVSLTAPHGALGFH